MQRFLFRTQAAFAVVWFFLVGIAFGQSGVVLYETHPEVSGGRQYMSMESPTVASSEDHTEGILDRYFPRIHGNDALHLDYVYTGGVFNNSRGGKQTRDATSYLGLATITIVGDTEKLGLWKNGTFFVNSLFSSGYSPTKFVGDTQYFVVFDYETPAQVSEYWYEHRFFRNRLIVKAGKQDAGTDFFYLDATADFINSSYTCQPTTFIPTAPSNAWGIAATLNITDKFHLKGGIFDAQANANKFWLSESGDVYAAYQLEYHYSLCCGLPGFFFVGGWNDNRSHALPHEAAVEKTGNGGFSIGWEQAISRRNVLDKKDSRGLYYFVNYGDAKPDRTDLCKYWGTGFVLRGIGNRNDDSLGVAVNYAYFSKEMGLPAAYESALEFYYKAQLTKNCSLQPDLQVIANPGGEYRDAVTTGLVFQLVF